MPKEKRFNCRISAEDHEKISSKAAEAGVTMTDFVIASCMNKRITVINDLKPMVNQLRRAGITMFVTLAIFMCSTAPAEALFTVAFTKAALLFGIMIP